MQECDDKIIPLLGDLKSSLKSFCSCYLELTPLLDLERQAIVSHSLKDLEEIIVEKSNIGTRIEELLSTTELVYEKLKAIFPHDFPFTLSACADLSKKISNINTSALQREVLKYQCKQVEEICENFLAKQDEIHKSIIQNRFIGKKLLDSYQQNIHFWQEVESQEIAPYNAKGRKVDQGKISQFFVKA